METQAKHTPTPWAIWDKERELNPETSTGALLIVSPPSVTGYDETEDIAVICLDNNSAANAEFIVKACNNYQEMRNLLARALEELYVAGSSTVADDIDRFLLRGYDRELDVYYNVAEGFEV